MKIQQLGIKATLKFQVFHFPNISKSWNPSCKLPQALSENNKINKNRIIKCSSILLYYIYTNYEIGVNRISYLILFVTTYDQYI